MNKIEWMSNLYQDACMGYIKNKPESAKDDLEKILFLMQYDSLQDKKNEKPMMPYKIYIDNEHICVRYISDLLRVTRFMPKFWYFRRRPPLMYHSYKTEGKYMRLFNKYTKLSKEELDDRVKEILSRGNMNSKYFVYGKYTDKFIRRVARLMLYNAQHKIQAALWFIWIIFSMMMVFATPFSIKVDSFDYFIYLYMNFLKASVISISLWFLWTIKITQPTAYELENLREKDAS